MSQGPIVRLGIRVRADRAEIALAQLLPILHAGAEERELDGDVEYSLYALAGELPRLDDIRALAGDAVVDVVSEPVPDGWERRWHEFLRPVAVGPLVVRPPWVEGGDDDLVIDPGVFFGAGTHTTTRLCLELLLDVAAVIERPPERLIASGLLVGEVDEVVAAFGMREERRLVDGEWAAVVLG